MMQFTTPKRPSAPAPKYQDTPAPERISAPAVTFTYDPLIRELVAGMGERRHRVTRAVAAVPAPAPVVVEAAPAPAARRWFGGALLALGGAAAVLLATAGTATTRAPLTRRPTGGVSAAPVNLTKGGPTWI